MKTPNDPDILTAEQVANLLGVNTNTVYEVIRQRVNPLPHRRLGKKLLRFHKEAVLDWIRTGQGAGRK